MSRKEFSLINALDLLESASFIVVMDLEATNGVPWEEREIIELGCVSRGLKKKGKRRSFHSFVRPTLHPSTMTEWSQQHAIKLKKLVNAPTFPEVFDQFMTEVWHEEACLASWGEFDYLMLIEEFNRKATSLHELGYNRFPIPQDRFVNLKELAIQFFNLKGERSLTQMLGYLGIKFRGTHHRALDDAKNTAKILDFILNGYVLK